jgi:pilus assembly protein CpaC
MRPSMHPRSSLRTLLTMIGCLSLVVVPAASQAAAPVSSDTTEITVGVGTQKVLSIQGRLKTIAIGDPETAGARTVGNEILVLGVKEGETTLLIWLEDGTRLSYLIKVRKRAPDAIAREVKALLGEMEGITIRIVGDKVYVEGTPLTSEDAERLKKVLALYPEVRDLSQVGGGVLRANIANLKRAFEENGLKSVVANRVGNSVFLEGTVESAEDLKKAELIVKAVGAQVENLITVGIKRMVLVEVQIVEIRRTDQLGLGITYPTNLSSDTASLNSQITNTNPPNVGQPPTQTVIQGTLNLTSNVAVRMRFDSGYGRLLSQPKLVCSSGEKAEFLVGGEVPVVLISANIVDVQFKPFGVKLNLTPNADRQGNIQTTIEAEVSEVDTTLTVTIGGTSVPGFRTRRVKTNVTVKHGETIVLSGLFNYEQQKDVSKVPLLGHIPIIGELFKSRQFTENKNELAIFVTPKIVNPDSDRIRETIDKIKERYKDASEAVGFSIWD